MPGVLAWMLGAQLKLKSWKFGIMARDITNTFNAWTHNTSLIFDIFSQTGNEIPQNSLEITLPRVIIGIAKEFNIKENFGILATMDFGTTFDGTRNVLIKSETVSIAPSFGLELDYKKMVFLRFAVSNFQEIKDINDNSTYISYQPNFGLGLKIKKFTIDYALTDVGDQAEALYSNVFSLKVGFGK